MGWGKRMSKRVTQVWILQSKIHAVSLGLVIRLQRPRIPGSWYKSGPDSRSCVSLEQSSKQALQRACPVYQLMRTKGYNYATDMMMVWSTKIKIQSCIYEMCIREEWYSKGLQTRVFDGVAEWASLSRRYAVLKRPKLSYHKDLLCVYHIMCRGSPRFSKLKLLSSSNLLRSVTKSFTTKQLTLWRPILAFMGRLRFRMALVLVIPELRNFQRTPLRCSISYLPSVSCAPCWFGITRTWPLCSNGCARSVKR